HANWKFQCENTVDGYQGNYVHRSFQEAIARSNDDAAPRQVTTGQRSGIGDQVAFRELGSTRGFVNGHGSLDRPLTEERLAELEAADDTQTVAELIQRVGRERAASVLAQHNL